MSRRRLYFFIAALALLVLALLGWTADAMRWAASGSRLRPAV